MKTSWLTAFSEDGKGVELRDVPMPTPGPGEVLVCMSMASINPSDFNYINGTYHRALSPFIWNHGKRDPSYAPSGEVCPSPPYALGAEGVGVVESAGKGWLAKRLVGKRVAVAGGPPRGTWKEYALIDAKRAFPIPKAMKDEEAASFFINPMTALVMVLHVLCVPRGATLLLTAVGSALGGMVRNLATLDGFDVINVVCSEQGAARLRDAGAKHVIATENGELIDAVHAAASDGVSYALDCVGGELGSLVLRCLKPNGHMLSYGTLSGQPMSFSPRDLIMPRSKLEGFYLPNWLGQQSLFRRIRLVKQTASLIVDGTLASPVQRVYFLLELGAALSAAAASGRSGKILLRMNA